jgi:hypothetical protein
LLQSIDEHRCAIKNIVLDRAYITEFDSRCCVR